MTWPQWTSMLSAWQWGVLALVPPAIIALYFLKLKRQPLAVPSTYLWHKSIDDLRVNSIWQRLRQSLLLFLQLLLWGLLALVLVRPSWQGSSFQRDRLVFLVDNSASMGATDVYPTRLDEAKRRVQELIDEMRSGDVAMIVSFADTARVEQMFTDNRGELRRRLETISATDRPTSISEALRVASVLANPQQDDAGGVVSAGLPTQLFIFSDGNFADDPDFSLGHLEPTPPVWIGEPRAANVAIVAFNTARSEANNESVQAFGRLANDGPQDVSLDVELHLDGALVDAQHVKIPAAKTAGVSFDVAQLTSGVLELRLAHKDDLAIDDRAWAVVPPPRRSRVLFVTPGNEALATALRTGPALELAEVTKRSPDFLSTPEYRQAAAAGQWDLVIFDRCEPAEAPQANTLSIGRLPVGDQWRQKDVVSVPQIIDINRSHPLMQWLDLSDVLILEAAPLVPPRGATMLIEAADGPLVALAPREGFEDVVITFPLVASENAGTNWPLRASFPVFVLNALSYLGGNRDAAKSGAPRPGDPIVLKPQTSADALAITPPGEHAGPITVSRDKHNEFHFLGSSRVGLYTARAEGEVVDEFAVNLFDPRESDIQVVADRKLKIGHEEIAAGTGWQETRRDVWKFVLAGALAILLFEWYIYNRRAYL
ncbi:MAG TPA: BatA and WFA domain-containing protein [Pirellulales bacterium]|nr:BatA and WFA domain-containing protein [Pirellulales bacterium]